MSNTIQFGVHILFDGYNIEFDLLKNKEKLEDFLYSTTRELGMHTISEPTVVEVGPLNKKDPGGVSGFILIAESHISFHTFPARGFITVDIYTCQSELDDNLVKKILIDYFQTSEYDLQIIQRGTKYPEHDIY